MTKTTHRFEVIELANIDIDKIEPHDFNPRPGFMTEDDDPSIIALGEAIATNGQTNAAVVYEKVNNYRGENEPGTYRLYQGERRWRACKATDVPTLRCEVVRPPSSEAEEHEWLGTEDAFKQDWGPFFILRHAQRLADALGVSVYSQEISAKTGVPMRELALAKKVFSLQEPILAYVAEYEELMYEQRVIGQRRKRGRLSGYAGIRSKEFPVSKAALVFDLFTAVRAHTPVLAKAYDDLELQRRLASKATSSTTEDLSKLHSQLKQFADKPPPGLLTQVKKLLEDDDHEVVDVIRKAGVDQAAKVDKFMNRSDTLRRHINSMIVDVDQLTNDPDQVDGIVRECLELLKTVGELDRAMRTKQVELLKVRM